MTFENDTIAAIASALPHGNGGDGAIGIIRISGIGAFDTARSVFRGKKPFDIIKPYTIAYGSVFDYSANTAVDEVLLLKMKAPLSYTREDVVEIHCHAGAEVTRHILRLILRAGARAAEPGEFTKRAFLNGRIDLTQAEAVMDIIRASGEAGSSAAMRRLEGGLKKTLGAAREKLISLIASLEAYLDFPEHDVGEAEASSVEAAISDITTELRILHDGYEYGRAAREGITCVIIGRPNVGKSTLLNLLAGQERAIVTDIPGTTRDLIDEYRNLGGFTVRFLDTAGIRDTKDAVERLGVERAVGAIEKADLVLLMFNAAEGFTAEDARLFALAAGKKIIAVINKTDAADTDMVGAVSRAVNETVINTAIKKADGVAEKYFVIEASLLTGDGQGQIEDAIRSLFGGDYIAGQDVAVLANERQYALVTRGITSTLAAGTAIRAGLPFEMAIVDMRDALSALGEITGATYSEEIIDRVFSEFCVGK